MGIEEFFYMNFHLRDRLEVDFIYLLRQTDVRRSTDVNCNLTYIAV